MGLTIAHFSGYFDSAEHINLLNSEVADWKEKFNNIRAEAMNNQPHKMIPASNSVLDIFPVMIFIVFM